MTTSVRGCPKVTLGNGVPKTEFNRKGRKGGAKFAKDSAISELLEVPVRRQVQDAQPSFFRVVVGLIKHLSHTSRKLCYAEAPKMAEFINMLPKSPGVH